MEEIKLTVHKGKQKRLKKVAFTMRLEESITDRLESLTQKSSKAAVARNYLNLANYFIVNPNLTLEMPDGTQLMVVPKTTMQNIYHSLKRTQMIEVGDELGRIFNINFSLRQCNTIAEKIIYLQSIGWFDIKEIKKIQNDQSIIYYGILAKLWPLDLLHAFLYRILGNHKYPEEWRIEEFLEFLKLNPEKWEKEKKKQSGRKIAPMIDKFKGVLGGHLQNFEEDCDYYLFDVFSDVLPK
jgi:hypothetical protein